MFNRNYKSLIVFLIILVAIIIVAYVFYNILQLSDEDNVVRSDDELILVGKYMGYACGDFTPQILPITGFPIDLELDQFGAGLIFYVPKGIMSPDQIDNIRVPGNRFELRGYYYYHVTDGHKKLYPRFDLTAWRPIFPLQSWSSEGDIETLQSSNDFNQFWEKQKDESFEFSPAGKYIMECN